LAHDSAARRQAGVDFEAHGLGARIREAHLRIDALAGRQERGGRNGRWQIGLGRHVTHGDAVAEAILQRHPQQRQGLRLSGAVLDAGAYRDQGRTGRFGRARAGAS
jgi:hypothetical protein